MKKILVLSFGLVLLAAACNKPSTPAPEPAAYTTPQQSPAPEPAAYTTPKQLTTSVEVAMTASGFSPNNITVKSGTIVVFKNTDSSGHWPASNPHPIHSDLSEFDSKQPVPAGGSYSFTFTKVGTWGYHDHLNASHRGTVTVTQ